MHDDSELITPAEAFRCCAPDTPERPALADEIVSSDWFLDRQWRSPVSSTPADLKCGSLCPLRAARSPYAGNLTTIRLVWEVACIPHVGSRIGLAADVP